MRLCEVVKAKRPVGYASSAVSSGLRLSDPRVETLGKTAEDRREDIGAAVPVAAQPGETRRDAQIERLCLP